MLRRLLLKKNFYTNPLFTVVSVRGGMPQRGNFRGGHRGGFNPSFRNNVDSFGQKIPPPPGYICYRCLGKGKDVQHSSGCITVAQHINACTRIDHFINDCPTNGNAEFDKPKLKRTTGIPKAFLVKVEQTERDRGNVMVTTTGDLVVAAPNR